MVSVLLAMSASVVMILAISRSVIQSNKTLKQMESSLAFMNLTTEVSQLLSDDASCDPSFAGASFSANAVGTVSDVSGFIGGSPLENLLNTYNDNGNLTTSQVNIIQKTAGATSALFDVELVMSLAGSNVPKRKTVGRVNFKFTGTTIDNPNACFGSVTGDVETGMVNFGTNSQNIGNSFTVATFVGGATQDENGTCGGFVINNGGGNMEAAITSLASGAGPSFEGTVPTDGSWACADWPGDNNRLCVRVQGGDLEVQTGNNCKTAYLLVN